MNTKPKSSPDKELVKIFEAAGVVDFMEYLNSGKRILWVNFKAGVAKGLGMTVGVAVILGILVWILTLLIDLPVVGEYFASAKQYITEYAEDTNYKDEFVEMNESLREINENITEVIEAEPEQPQ
jgi:hypothetical protein